MSKLFLIFFLLSFLFLFCFVLLQGFAVCIPASLRVPEVVLPVGLQIAQLKAYATTLGPNNLF